MKIAGIGDNVIDRYLNKGVMYPGGNAVNVAAHAARLGADAAYLGVLGDDLGGAIISDALTALHVDLSHAPVCAGATTKTCDMNVFDGERQEVGYDTGSAWAHKDAITQEDIAYLQDFDAVFTSVNAKLQDDVHMLRDCSGVVVYDFSVKEKYRTPAYFDLVCPVTTLGLFSCSGVADADVRALLQRAHDAGCRYTLATRGMAGPMLFDGASWYTGTVKHVDALDTMGAGDSYITAFVVKCLELGWSRDRALDAETISTAMAFAADYSAQNCMRAGGFGFEHPLQDLR